MGVASTTTVDTVPSIIPIVASFLLGQRQFTLSSKPEEVMIDTKFINYNLIIILIATHFLLFEQRF